MFSLNVCRVAAPFLNYEYSNLFNSQYEESFLSFKSKGNSTGLVGICNEHQETILLWKQSCFSSPFLKDPFDASFLPCLHGLVKAQIALEEASQQLAEKEREKNQGFDFDSFIAGTIQLSSQHEPTDVVDKLNDLNSSVSQLESKSLISKSVSREKQEKGMANLAQLEALYQSSWDSQFVGGAEDCFLINQFCCEVRKDEQIEKENTYTSYLDKFFSRKEDTEMLDTEPIEDGKFGERGNEEGFLNNSGEFLFNKQLESIGIPQFHSPVGSPLKSIQATLTPSAMKSSPQIPHKTYSSILKHLN